MEFGLLIAPDVQSDGGMAAAIGQEHRSRRQLPPPPSFLRAAHTLLRALLKQCALIDLLEHAQAHLPAHLVILLQVPYSIHRGFFLSAAVWILSLQYVRKAPPLSSLALI